MFILKNSEPVGFRHLTAAQSSSLLSSSINICCGSFTFFCFFFFSKPSTPSFFFLILIFFFFSVPSGNFWPSFSLTVMCKMAKLLSISCCTNMTISVFTQGILASIHAYLSKKSLLRFVRLSILEKIIQFVYYSVK